MLKDLRKNKSLSTSQISNLEQNISCMHPVFKIHQPVRSIHESAWAQGAGINEPLTLLPSFASTTSRSLTAFANLSCICIPLRMHMICWFLGFSDVENWNVLHAQESRYLIVVVCLRFKITVVVSLKGCVFIFVWDAGRGAGELWEVAAHLGKAV